MSLKVCLPSFPNQRVISTNYDPMKLKKSEKLLHIILKFPTASWGEIPQRKLPRNEH